jgi:hypothetical protein
MRGVSRIVLSTALVVGLAACPKPAPSTDTGGTAGTAGTCRTSDTPLGCTHVTTPPGSTPGIGGHQGVYLEGETLEHLHFTSHAFPPPPGTVLHAVESCGKALRPVVTVRSCKAIPELPGALGAVTCQVDVTDFPGICKFKPFNAILDPDPVHHRGVTIVRGYWDATAGWHDEPGVVTLSCDAKNNTPDVQQFEDSDGAITKCVRTFHLDPQAFSDAFQACIRMVRADYCGDGTPHTFLGTEVGVSTPHDPMTVPECTQHGCFEASWSKHGAVCVARTRWSGPGMGLDACQGQFAPTGGMSCRSNPDEGIVFSRSEQHVCNQFAPGPCGPDLDPFCASHGSH